MRRRKRKRFKKFTLGAAGLLLLVLLVLWASFYFWRENSIASYPGNSRVIETPKGPIEYLVQGNSERHVLLVHGTPGSYRTFGISPLLKNGYSVISLSRPGYFRTPLFVGRSPEDQADAFAMLLDELGIDSVAVIGISGGGPSSLQFAIRHPEKCSRLVLMGAVSRRQNRGPQSVIQQLFSTEFGTWLQVQMMLWQMEDADLARRAEHYVRTTMFPFSKTGPGKRNDIAQMENLPDYPFGQVQVPTLIIHGTEDRRVPFGQAQYLAEQIPGAELAAIEGKGHFPVVFSEFDASLDRAIGFLANEMGGQ